MAWKTTTFESIDIRDGYLHEIFVSDHSMVETKPREGEKKPGKAHKYFGIEKSRGPVSFLATDNLAKDLGETCPMLIRVQWKGKVAIKGGSQMFNVFACESYECLPNEELPAWTKQSAFAGQEMFIDKETVDEELPEVGPIEIAKAFIADAKSDPRDAYPDGRGE